MEELLVLPLFLRRGLQLQQQIAPSKARALLKMEEHWEDLFRCRALVRARSLQHTHTAKRARARHRPPKHKHTSPPSAAMAADAYEGDSS